MIQLHTTKGVTIIENVVAITILALVIPALIIPHISAHRNTTVAFHHYQAVNIARNYLEQILSGAIILAPGASYTTTTINGLPIGLNGGTIAVDYDAATLNIHIVVNWVEKTWTDLDCQEGLIAFVP